MWRVNKEIYKSISGKEIILGLYEAEYAIERIKDIDFFDTTYPDDRLCKKNVSEFLHNSSGFAREMYNIHGPIENLGPNPVYDVCEMARINKKLPYHLVKNLEEILELSRPTKRNIVKKIFRYYVREQFCYEDFNSLFPLYSDFYESLIQVIEINGEVRTHHGDFYVNNISYYLGYKYCGGYPNKR